MNVDWSLFRDLTEANVRAVAPQESGVYLLWKQEQQGLTLEVPWRCYYVGQAEDLRDRLLEHLSAEEDNPCIRKIVASSSTSRFHCGIIYSQEGRDGAEKFLYDYLKEPKCNRVDPGGIPISVTVPRAY